MIEVSAPGKILWLGGYSVLEQGNTAWVQTVNARVYGQIHESGHIQINVPQFGVKTVAQWKNKKLTLKEDVPAANFAKHAIQTCFEYLESQKKLISPFSLSTKSDAAFNVGHAKSGLGSSAAATAAMCHAVLVFHGVNDLKKTHHCAQVAHSRAQGKIGSGFDVAAACFGSIEYKRFSPECVEQFPNTTEWDDFVRPVSLTKNLHLAFSTFPKESASTMSMVKQVKVWRKNNEEKYQTIISQLNKANVNALAYLEQFQESKNTSDLEAFKTHFQTARAITRQLGEKSGASIEGPFLETLIDESLENGAFVCKSPGAGGMDSLSALCLGQKKADQVKAFWKEKGLMVFDIQTDHHGLRRS